MPNANGNAAAVNRLSERALFPGSTKTTPHRPRGRASIQLENGGGRTLFCLRARAQVAVDTAPSKVLSVASALELS